MGDFNEVLLFEEKSGVRIRPERQIEEFYRALTNSDLWDHGLWGPLSSRVIVEKEKP